MTRLHPAFSPFGLPIHLIASPAFRFLRSSSFRHFGPVHCAGLGAGSELVVHVFEQDVERGKRSVTARELPGEKAFGEGTERDTRGAYAPRSEKLTTPAIVMLYVIHV